VSSQAAKRGASPVGGEVAPKDAAAISSAFVSFINRGSRLVAC
jgi:hypothetical protein